MLMQTPQQRLERERKERREGQQDPQGLPKDCEIKDRSTVATNPTEGSIFRARCRRFMVQAAINGHNQFKRAQALEGRLYYKLNKGTCRGSDGGAGLMKMIAVAIYRRTGRRACLAN